MIHLIVYIICICIYIYILCLHICTLYILILCAYINTCIINKKIHILYTNISVYIYILYIYVYSDIHIVDTKPQFILRNGIFRNRMDWSNQNFERWSRLLWNCTPFPDKFKWKNDGFNHGNPLSASETNAILSNPASTSSRKRIINPHKHNQSMNPINQNQTKPSNQSK